MTTTIKTIPLTEREKQIFHMLTDIPKPHPALTAPHEAKGVQYMCANIHGSTFATPDGKWLIHVRYETEQEEHHKRDEFNPQHIEHYVRVTDKIHSVSVEAV